MISFNKTLVYASMLCLLSINCKAGVFQQITLRGEYLTPNGLHPGIPHTPTPSNWTAWQDVEEVEGEDVFGDPIITTTCSLLLNNGQETILLDSYPQNSWPGGPIAFGESSFTNIIVDGDRVSWERRDYILRTLKIYSNEIFTSHAMDFSFGYEYAFSSNFLLVAERGYNDYGVPSLDILFTDTMVWKPLIVTGLNQIFPENYSSALIGRYSMKVYQNGIELLQPRQYIGIGDTTFYMERFWMEIPEPMTIILMGIGASGLLIQRKKTTP